MPSQSRKPPFKNTAPIHPAPELRLLPTAYFFAPDLEREINRLENITSARVLSTGSEIDEIHVVAPPDRPPKKIVRDIESLLLVRFGIRIDHRCISIVQMDNVRTAYPQDVRPLISGIARENGSIHVTLTIGERAIHGQSECREEQEDATTTARAVVHAIEQLLQTPGVLTVLKTHVAELNEFRTMLVLIRWIFSEQQELLLGASLVHDDLLETAARATLDAVNRRLVRIHTSQG